jgi:hypothetical protein
LEVELWDVVKAKVCDVKDDSSIGVLGVLCGDGMYRRRRLSKRGRSFQKGMEALLKGSLLVGLLSSILVERIHRCSLWRVAKKIPFVFCFLRCLQRFFLWDGGWMLSL